MTATNVTASRKPLAKPPISFFERYLTVWVALCVVAGILAGQFFPAVSQAIGRMLPRGMEVSGRLMLGDCDLGSLSKREMRSMLGAQDVERLAGHPALTRSIVAPTALSFSSSRS